MSCFFSTMGAATAHAAAFDTYGTGGYRAIAMPVTGPGSFGLSGDVMRAGSTAGRIVCVTGNQLFIESGVGTGAFAPVATFDPAQSGGSTDPAFVRVSPDGSRIAVGLGAGKPIAIFPVSSLGTSGSPTLLNSASGATYYNVAHTEGAWRNNSELALTAGDFGSTSRVTLLDTLSPPASPTNPTIITNIGGASAGVAFDSTGRLFTGNGFDLATGGGQSQTGWIKAFSPTSWSGSAADFESAGGGGTFIADVLSATALVFDTEGNLAIGGGDFGDSFDAGYLGVLSAGAIHTALLGGTINTSDPSQLKHLIPSSNPFAFYSAAFNPLTGELYAAESGFTPGDPNTWHATIPAPSAASLAFCGFFATRRRR